MEISSFMSVSLSSVISWDIRDRHNFSNQIPMLGKYTSYQIFTST